MEGARTCGGGEGGEGRREKVGAAGRGADKERTRLASAADTSERPAVGVRSAVAVARALADIVSSSLMHALRIGRERSAAAAGLRVAVGVALATESTRARAVVFVVDVIVVVAESAVWSVSCEHAGQRNVRLGRAR